MLLFGTEKTQTSDFDSLINQNLVINAPQAFLEVNGSIPGGGVNNIGTTSFEFFGNGMTAYYNSAILQWSSDTSRRAQFLPKN